MAKKTSGVPEDVKAQLDRWAAKWIPQSFGRLLELRAEDPGPFNYPVEVYSEWRGKVFYLSCRFRARSRRPEDDFVVRKTRLTARSFGRFDSAYFRHTNKWHTVFEGLTAPECIKEIESNELFWPTA